MAGYSAGGALAEDAILTGLAKPRDAELTTGQVVLKALDGQAAAERRKDTEAEVDGVLTAGLGEEDVSGARRCVAHVVKYTD